jgi:hypothetical protein
MTRLRLADDEVLLVFATIAIKALLLLGGAAAYVWLGVHADGPLGVWNRWDAPHYLDIVVFGYRAVDAGDLVGPDGYRSVYPGDLPLYIVFYPLYPWLATVVNAGIGSPLASALVVSGLASLLVAPLLYRLVRADEEAGVALRAGLFVLIFPTAYFLHIGYTESLFLAVTLGSFLAARHDRWWLAGLLGGLAALSRINGLLLIPSLAAEAATQWFEQPAGERRFRVRWLAIGLVAAGFGGYLALNLAVYGDPLHFLFVQRSHWGKSLALPWEGIDGVLGYFGAADLEDAFMYGFMELLFILVGVAGTVYAAFRFRPSWFVWMTGNMLLFASTAFVLSTPRYALVLFPIFVVLARLTANRSVLVAVSLVSLCGLVYFAARFAAGVWAF